VLAPQNQACFDRRQIHNFTASTEPPLTTARSSAALSYAVCGRPEEFSSPEIQHVARKVINMADAASKLS